MMASACGASSASGPVAVDAHAEVDFGHAVAPDGGDRVEQQGEVDRVALGERELFEQRRAGPRPRQPAAG